MSAGPVTAPRRVRRRQRRRLALRALVTGVVTALAVGGVIGTLPALLSAPPAAAQGAAPTSTPTGDPTSTPTGDPTPTSTPTVGVTKTAADALVSDGSPFPELSVTVSQTQDLVQQGIRISYSNGEGLASQTPGFVPNTRSIAVKKLAVLRCSIITPLGRPVEPDVKMT